MSDSTLLAEATSGLHYRRFGSATPQARLVLLHGVGGNERNLEVLVERLDPRLELLLVRAPLGMGAQSFAWFPVHFGASGPRIDAAQAERSRTLLANFLRGLAPLPTVLAGFSQGGIMSASVALSEPELLVGFGVLSGRILPEIEPRVAAPEALARLRGFVAHGRFDDKLSFAWAERSRQWLSELGVNFAFHEYPMGHQLCDAEIEDLGQWLSDVLRLR